MKSDKVISLMISRNLIPETGVFEVTYELIDEFYNFYREVYPPKNKTMKSNNVKFAKKIAGLNLMKLNIARSEFLEERKQSIKTIKPKCGLIYLVSNPIFPNMYKIGMTRDLNKRLSQYQTSDPYRRYKVEHYKFVEDARSEERKYLKEAGLDIVNGEWITSDKLSNLFDIIFK